MQRHVVLGLLALGVVTAQLPCCAEGAVEGDPVGDDGDGGDAAAPIACDRAAKEICNGRDDNCDGRVDEGFDNDGDGFVTCAVNGRAADCDDADRAVNPGVAEACNERDDNCDGKIDEGFDKDNDGFYECARGTVPADCNDGNADIKPGGTEVCNGRDDNCDGKIDDVPATLNGLLTPTLDLHWRLTGSATLSTGGVRLTAAVDDQSGGLWWVAHPAAPLPYTFDTFDMTATVIAGNGADGITFAWVPPTATNGVPGVGLPGHSVGLVGLGGYGVGIDTYANDGDPAPPFLAVYNGQSGAHLHRVALPNIRGVDTALRVRLDAGKVSVWVGGASYITDFVIPGYTPFKGYWGFTAATGGENAAHWVRGTVSMSFPNGQGCIEQGFQ